LSRAKKISETRKSLTDADGAASVQDGNALTPLAERFNGAQSKLSASRQQLLRAILEDHDETYFLSSRELAERYGVDAATIVRTIQALGYKKFADFAADLRRHFVTQITPYTAMKVAAQKRGSVADHVQHGVERDLENLNSLKANLNVERIVETAKLLHRSRRILVVGVDFAASLAWSFAYGLVRLGLDAEAPVGSIGNLLHKTGVLNGKDLLIAISFGRGLKATVESALLARKRGVPTFGITDSETTPVARYCDSYLIAPTTRASFIDSYIAPVSTINAILIACAHTRAKHSLDFLNRTEKEPIFKSRWYQDAKTSNGKNR